MPAPHFLPNRAQPAGDQVRQPGAERIHVGVGPRVRLEALAGHDGDVEPLDGDCTRSERLIATSLNKIEFVCQICQLIVLDVQAP